MIILNWKEFNDCIHHISKKCKNKDLKGVYGFPRGGLCLAVALSHSLEIPLLKEPQNNSLIVDDIYETGQTLSSIKKLTNIKVFVWYSKVKPTWWYTYKLLKTNEWIIFPWERISKADKDKQDYIISRQI